MITTLDRMVLVAFFRSYAIVWSSLIGLFVVIDLFTHLDAYMSRPGGFIAIANYIIRYYAFRVPQVFDLLAEPISLMAATFTVAWMQKNNELLPQLSAGIPTRRIIRPILLGRGHHDLVRALESRVRDPRDRRRTHDRPRRPGRLEGTGPDGGVRHFWRSSGRASRFPAR